MSRRKTIGLEEIPTLKQDYEERKFSPRNLKRAITFGRKYEHNEEFNKKLSLIQADITKLKIDAIVNAANETLLGGGGVDGAIHRAAGPELRHECWDLNGCDTGDAKITKGYDLPSKHVIHTVGPVGEKPSLLRSAYERSMQVMRENDLKSIAFSNISTGVYGYPRGKAGHIALETMRKWLEQNPDYFDKLDRIIFCVFEDENKDVYETLFPVYFPPPDDIENYLKEEEKLRPKTNEEKKDNEAGKDKDQVKTYTSLTAEQINNKEIIGTDNETGIKGTDNDNGVKGTDNDNGNKGTDNDNGNKGTDNDNGNKGTDNDNGIKGTDNDNGIKEKDEEKSHETLTTGQVNDSTDKDKKHKEKVEGQDKIQDDTDVSAESAEDTGMSVEQGKQDTDVSAESTKQGRQVPAESNEQDTEMPNATTEQNKQDVEMLNASTEPDIPDASNKQDESKSHDIEMLEAQDKTQKHNEQNSKKRSHDSVTPDEQDDAKESQNNITNVTGDPDVIMKDAEPTTDAAKMDEDPKTSQTDGNTSKNEDDSVTKNETSKI